MQWYKKDGIHNMITGAHVYDDGIHNMDSRAHVYNGWKT